MSLESREEIAMTKKLRAIYVHAMFTTAHFRMLVLPSLFINQKIKVHKAIILSVVLFVYEILSPNTKNTDAGCLLTE
jgi:hypothetical protein